MAHSTNVRESKTLGALLGVHAGDSLGATVEFDSWAKIRSSFPNGLRDIIGGGVFRWPAGHATDDTDLTRAVLLAYHDLAASRKTKAWEGEDASFDVVKAAADYAIKWFTGDWPGRANGSMPDDIGGATNVGLSKYQASQDPRKAGAGKDSAGNGSLMRCIPTALFSHSAEERKKESMEISAITHDDERCTVSCAVYNEIVAGLLQGKTPKEAVEVGEQVAQELDCEAVTAVLKRAKDMSISRIASGGPGKELPDRTSGYVLQSLTVAVAALLDPRSLEDVLVDVVRIGGDTDTNGAIAGGLLGARDGIEGIPERWLDVLQFRGEFEDVAKRIMQLQSG